MAKEFAGLRDTPEELEYKRRRAAGARLRIIVVIAVVSILARFIIKDPPPPKTPDRTQQKIRYVPGMLEQLPKSALDKMDPRLIAEIRKAETDTQMAKLKNPAFYAKGSYKAADAPLENASDKEIQKQFAFATKKTVKVRIKENAEPVDVRKTTLVRFRSGGAIKAEKAIAQNAGYQIEVDRTMLARLPRVMVAGVTANVLNWKEPIPSGCVQLRPAKGITITVNRETARRISVTKQTYDET